MADEKKRTVEDVQREYNQGCLRAGHLQYQIATLQKDLVILNDTLRDLNFEAASIQAKSAEEAKAKAEQEAKSPAAPEMPKLEGLKNE